jgi:hypothetical protein
VVFDDIDGKKHRKNLTGYSKKYDVHWGAALEGKPIVRGDWKIALKLHVSFTTDGTTPISSSARIHRLRRSFCKSWWNDRWRGLLLAYLEWLRDDQETIQIRTDGDSDIFVSAWPDYLVSNFSFSAVESVEENDESDVDLDEISGEFLDPIDEGGSDNDEDRD